MPGNKVKVSQKMKRKVQDLHNKENMKNKMNEPRSPITPLDGEKLKQLMNIAEAHMDTFEYAKASKICDCILIKLPTNVQALELRASIAIEMSDSDMAGIYLDKAIALEPTTGYRKYLSKAQLLHSKGALNCYKKAIEILKVEINQCPKQTITTTASDHVNDEDESMDVDETVSTSSNTTSTTSSPSTSKHDDHDKLSATLRRDVSSVYCSVVELFLTDLCDEPDAQDQCVDNIDLALLNDSDNPEVHVIKARYEVIIGKKELATASIEKSLSLWLPFVERDQDSDSDDDSSDNGDDDAATGSRGGGKACDGVLAEELLDAETRLNTARLLIELQRHDSAHAVLQTLLREDDQIVEVWYLLGWNCFQQGEEMRSPAKQFLAQAKMTQRSCPCEDDILLGHIDELLKQLQDVETDDDDGDEEDEDLLEKEILEQEEKAG